MILDYAENARYHSSIKVALRMRPDTTRRAKRCLGPVHRSLIPFSIYNPTNNATPAITRNTPTAHVTGCGSG